MIQLVKPGREVESVTIISGKQVTLGEGWWLEPPLGSNDLSARNMRSQWGVQAPWVTLAIFPTQGITAILPDKEHNSYPKEEKKKWKEEKKKKKCKCS